MNMAIHGEGLPYKGFPLLTKMFYMKQAKELANTDNPQGWTIINEAEAKAMSDNNEEVFNVLAIVDTDGNIIPSQLRDGKRYGACILSVNEKTYAISLFENIFPEFGFELHADGSLMVKNDG